MSKRIRKVRVHTSKRGPRLSRYERLNWAFRVGREMTEMNSDKRQLAFDCHLKFMFNNYAPLQNAEIMMIWLRHCQLNIDPVKSTQFDRFHRECGFLVFCNETQVQPYFFKVKKKIEFLVRGEIKLLTLDKLVYELLKAETEYSPLSETEYAELKQYVRTVAREHKFELEEIDRAYTIHLWRITNTNKRLYGIDILEEPEDYPE